jgi:hypothetical protein
VTAAGSAVTADAATTKRELEERSWSLDRKETVPSLKPSRVVLRREQVCRPAIVRKVA